ncbi:putative osmoregulation-related protein [Dioszegia hungarica]|uniref:Osmoregulation-related protein n=1 Tax=Dioszegia hungarica TaxID=4972 RepID=A0AA38HB65_9TREE|nr:putative osmoregulation-related protein [Dioszegia hungarica]KAI9638207.1 putative osmoregulation-related protein [Dioszegia hungarica]
MSYKRGSTSSRGRGGRQSGPQLPTTLMAEVDPSGSTSNRNRGRPRGAGPRNIPRPQKEDTKASLREFNAAQRPSAPSLPPSEPQKPLPRPKRQKIDVPAEPPAKKRKRPELSLPGKSSKDAEDGEIEWLEYMLRKEKGNEELEDGLDDLLGFADLVGPGGEGLGLADEEESVSDEDEGNSSDEDDEVTADAETTDDEQQAQEEAKSETATSPREPPPESTDDPLPTFAARYIPPHERAAQLEAKSRGDKAKELERAKLERKAQDVTTCLTNLILFTIANRSNLLDSFVILYATLVGALYRILGTEFGAHFAHATITKYHRSNPEDMAESSKSSLNLLTLIAELYNAQVIGANLIYDLIRSLLAETPREAAIMGEIQVEGLLKLLRCSGQQLRSDDPASLKDIVNLVQDKTKGKEKTMTTRARYMIETLVNLKGGKAKSTQNTDDEAVNRMKRFLGGLSRKRRVAVSEPLRVSLQDFLDADTRGKWWLVGAGWAGNPLVERERVTKVASTKTEAVEDEQILLEAARNQGMNTDVRRSIFVILMTSEDYIHACDRLSLLKFTETQQREFVRVALHCCATEKTYNPYHSLIINHLCAESYSHRFTLQYALWDFLRELGDDAGKAAKLRCANVAQMSAYVVGRRSLDITVFKAFDFVSLKPVAVHFFAVFVSRLCLATQTVSPLFSLPKAFRLQDIDEEAVEETFEKALTNYTLAQGLTWIVRRPGAVEQGSRGLGETAKSVIQRVISVASQVLSRAV